MSESGEVRLKRLRMRSMRRGIREMDMLLGAYAETNLSGMSAPQLDLFEALLEENDQDLLAWITGRQPVPDRYALSIAEIAKALAR